MSKVHVSVHWKVQSSWPKYTYLCIGVIWTPLVKFNIHAYFLLYICSPLPRSSNWIAALYGTFRSTRECTVPRLVPCTSSAFQFHHLLNDVSLPWYDEVKLQYSNWLWSHRKLNALYISGTMQVFGCNHRKGNIFLHLQWKGLGLIYETKNFPSNISWIPILSLFYPLSQQSRRT
jgi:hypothetical protein